MIFNVKKMINFISQGTTLLPGDVIMTGTPEGVQSLAFSHSRRWNGKETAIMAERWRHCRSRARERGQMHQQSRLRERSQIQIVIDSQYINNSTIPLISVYCIDFMR